MNGGKNRARSNIYALAALYLLYLFYKMATDGPGMGMLLLGAVVLLGGAALLGYFSWKMAHMPVEDEEPPEDLPESEEDGGEES